MMNQELVDTARLLVAAVQDSDSFSSDYLRRVIIHLVPQLIGEIEILDRVSALRLPDPVVVDAVDEEEDDRPLGLGLLSNFDRKPPKKKRRKDKKSRRKK